jgi:cellobiose transport system substrate-binding protein
MSIARTSRRGPLGLVAVLLAGATLVAGCSSGGSSGSPSQSNTGQITLRIGLFGTFGYKEAGLYAAYEKAHPNIKIVEDDSEQEANYWSALQTHLQSGSGLDDIQGIEIGRIADVSKQMSNEFVDLNTLGGASDKNEFAPFKIAPAITSDGKLLALGTDIGPMAVCYRSDLLKRAGLPTDPATLSKDWSSWANYLAMGQQYKGKVPGSAWIDDAGGLYNTIIGQSAEQYYDASGAMVLGSNPAVTSAWNTAVQAAQEGLTAKLSQFGTDWNKGFASGAFATIGCPAWMIGYIKGQAGPSGSGKWNIATVPGNRGNWGGSYLAIPKSSAHQQAAFDLIQYLTGAQAETTLFQKEGNFPSNLQAQQAIASVRDPYFQNAPIGQIFGKAAQNQPQVILGHDIDTISNDVSAGLLSIETQGKSPDAAWQAVLKQVQSDISSS